MANYWIQALKEFNKGKNTWCVAKKGTPENTEVRKIMERMKKEEPKEESKEPKKIDRTDQVKKGNKIPIVKEPHTMYKSSDEVKPNRKVLNAQHYDNWWDLTLEERNKHRKETIKKYEKELNEMKNKIKQKTQKGKMSYVDKTRNWIINQIMNIGLADLKDEDEEALIIPKYPREYWANIDDEDFFYKDEKKLLLTIAKNFGAFNY